MTQAVERDAVVLMVVAALLALTSVCPSTSSAAQQEGLTRVNRPSDAEQLRREHVLIRASGIEQWPESESLGVAPELDKSLLSKPNLVTREQRSHHVVVLDNIECGVAWVIWRHVVASDAPVPAELPKDLRQELEETMADLPVDVRERKLEGFLKGYRRSRMHTEKGRMGVKMVVAPSSRAAQEYLLFESTQCSLPIEARAAEFDESRRISELGDVAFEYSGSVRFVRNNVAVVIHAAGELANEAAALARKLDAAITRQPSLTMAQWLAARPRVRLGPLQHDSVSNQPALPFNLDLPSGTRVTSVHAKVNGTHAAVKEHKVLLGSISGQVTVRVSVITDSLLASSAEQVLHVDADR